MGHVIADHRRLWPQGIIPYVIDAAFTREGEADDVNPDESLPVALIERAIKEWNERTCLRFVPWTDQTDYIVFESSEGVSQSEYVGCNGGRQSLWINLRRARRLCGIIGGTALGVVIHELGHAVGLLHEHQRSDRDEHIVILWNNVDPDRLCGLCVRTQDAGCDHCELKEGRPVGPYDYDSVMHYFATQGAIDPQQPTIVAVAAGSRPAAPHGFGRCDGLSDGDIATIAAVYSGA